MRSEFTQISQVRMHYFKSFSREKSLQDEKDRFIKGSELKVTQTKYFHSLFLRVYHVKLTNVKKKQFSFLHTFSSCMRVIA